MARFNSRTVIVITTNRGDSASTDLLCPSKPLHSDFALQKSRDTVELTLAICTLHMCVTLLDDMHST